MDFSVNSRPKIAVFVAILFAWGLVFQFAVPESRRALSGSANNSNLPVPFKLMQNWGSSRAVSIAQVAIAIAFWIFYLSPVRRKFSEQSQVYLFGLALAAACALLLRLVALRI